MIQIIVMPKNTKTSTDKNHGSFYIRYLVKIALIHPLPFGHLPQGRIYFKKLESVFP